MGICAENLMCDYHVKNQNRLHFSVRKLREWKKSIYFFATSLSVCVHGSQFYRSHWVCISKREVVNMQRSSINWYAVRSNVTHFATQLPQLTNCFFFVLLAITNAFHRKCIIIEQFTRRQTEAMIFTWGDRRLSSSSSLYLAVCVRASKCTFP